MTNYLSDTPELVKIRLPKIASVNVFRAVKRLRVESEGMETLPKVVSPPCTGWLLGLSTRLESALQMETN